MSYVNNMSYVKLFELRHESCKLYEYFYKLLNPNVSVCVCLGGGNFTILLLVFP